MLGHSARSKARSHFDVGLIQLKDVICCVNERQHMLHPLQGLVCSLYRYSDVDGHITVLLMATLQLVSLQTVQATGIGSLVM